MARKTISPRIYQLLLLLNVSAFVLLGTNAAQLYENFALWPLGLSGRDVGNGMAPTFQLWQLISYSFLHGGIWHLLLNMYALWLFGARIEAAWGSKAFAIYYFFCVFGAGLVQLIVSTSALENNQLYPTVGASGGVFGLLLAFGITFPNERLILLFPPIPIKAKWFVLLYAAIELYFGVTGTLAGIAHFAHLGGMLFGFLLLWYWSRYPLKVD